MRYASLVVLVLLMPFVGISQTACPVNGGTAISGGTNISAAGTYYVSSGSTWTGAFQNIANVNSGTITIVICAGGTWDQTNIQLSSVNVPLTIENSGTIDATTLNLTSSNITLDNYGLIDLSDDLSIQNIAFNNFASGQIMAVDQVTLRNLKTGATNVGSIEADFIEVDESTDFVNSGDMTAVDIYIHSTNFMNTGTITSTQTNCQNGASSNCGLFFGTKSSPIVNSGTMTTNFLKASSNTSIDPGSTGTIEVSTRVDCPDPNSLWTVFCDNSATGLVYQGCNGSQSSSTPQCAILPVTILEFQVKKKNDEVMAYWMTSSEINFSHFELEASYDTRSYYQLEVISNAQGVSENLKMYRSSPILLNRDLYLRLKMVDLDGQYAYSETRFLGRITSSINVFPNPMISNTLNVNINNNQGAIVTVYSSDGKVIKRITNFQTSHLTIDLSSSKNSLYLVEVIHNNEVRTFKIIN